MGFILALFESLSIVASVLVIGLLGAIVFASFRRTHSHKYDSNSQS